MEEQVDVDRKRLANYKHETAELHDQFKTAVHAGTLPSAVSRQLAELARRYPSLSFDPATGIGKLDTDVLFDSGQAELKPAAQAMLAELSRVLQRQEADDLKVMVVGHTDNQRLAGPAVRERFPAISTSAPPAPWPWPTNSAARGFPSGVSAWRASGRINRSPPTTSPASGRRIAGWRSSSWPRTSPWWAGRIPVPACIERAYRRWSVLRTMTVRHCVGEPGGLSPRLRAAHPPG